MKKTISLMLCAAMALSLLSVSAFAQSGLENFKKSQNYTNGQFSDVNADSWYASNVQAACEYGLMNGMTDGSFGADTKVKLSEAVAMAARLHSIYTTGKADFASGSPWYQPYVDYAIANGIFSKGRFENYDVYATRYQVAEILAAALPTEALSAINSIDIGDIPDVSLETNYTSVYTLYRAGILTGKTASGNFCPAESMLRSESRAVVTRRADASLRGKVTIEKDSGGTAVSVKQLLEIVNNARQAALLATQTYSAAEEYYSASNSLGADSLNKAAEYTQTAAAYAQSAATSCQSGSYSAAYDDLNRAYLACLEADKAIVLVKAAPTGADTDWTSAQTLLNGSGEALARAAETISAIG